MRSHQPARQRLQQGLSEAHALIVAACVSDVATRACARVSASQRQAGIHQRDVGKRLREIADEPARVDIVFS